MVARGVASPALVLLLIQRMLVCKRLQRTRLSAAMLLMCRPAESHRRCSKTLNRNRECDDASEEQADQEHRVRDFTSHWRWFAHSASPTGPYGG